MEYFFSEFTSLSIFLVEVEENAVFFKNFLNNPNDYKKMDKEVNSEKNISKNIIETDKIEIIYDEESGHKIVNNFIFQEIIGRGAYSKVKRCIDKETKKELAVKVIKNYLLRKKKKAFDKTSSGSLLIHYMIEDAINEMKTYKAIPKEHPNILSLYQILNDNEKDKTYLIMELAEPLVTINEETGIFTLNNKFDNNKYDEKLIKKLSILHKFSKIFILKIFFKYKLNNLKE